MTKEVTVCRNCGGHISMMLSLGELYPSMFVKEQGEYEKVPLVIGECDDCRLAQLMYEYDLDKMYKEQYWYQSSLNKSMVKDLEDVAVKSWNKVITSSNNIVVDIGCNDGTLLEQFRKLNSNIITVGFDPAPNLKEKAENRMDRFINDYFSAQAFLDLGIEKKADIITSIAMFYDLPDPNSFIRDVMEILDDGGVWVIQFTDLYSMLKNNAVDNICHEHLEYYSLNVLARMLDNNGLQIFDVEYNKVNGGSLRVYVNFQNTREMKQEVVDALIEEAEYLNEFQNYYKSFVRRVGKEFTALKKFLIQEREKGKTIALYGASTKGNTFLQLADITKELVSYAVEVNPDKYGLRTIGTDIEILPEEHAPRPDYYLVPIWHFIDNIVDRNIQLMNRGTGFIVPLPEFKVYELAVEEKSISQLIDEFVTNQIKCFLAQDKLMSSTTIEEKVKAAEDAQLLNARRNIYMKAIDRKLDKNNVGVSNKTYG